MSSNALQARRQHVFDRFAAVVDGGDQRLGALAEIVGDVVAARGQRVG